MSLLFLDSWAACAGIGNGNSVPASVLESLALVSSVSLNVPGPSGYGASASSESMPYSIPFNHVSGNVFIGFRLLPPTTSALALDFVNDSSGVQSGIRFNPSAGSISILNVDETLVATSNPGVYNPYDWSYFFITAHMTYELITSGSYTVPYYFVDSITVYVNSLTPGAVVTASGLSPRYQIGGSPSHIIQAFIVQFGSVGTTEYSQCDVYVCDDSGSAPWNTHLGAIVNQALTPAGAGHVTSWTPNGAGTNWQAADNGNLNSITTYVSGTSGVTDLYALSTLPAAFNKVLAMQSGLITLGSGVGFEVYSGTTETTLGTLSSATTLGFLPADLYPTDPNTSSQWTTTAINTLQIGPVIP